MRVKGLIRLTTKLTETKNCLNFQLRRTSRLISRHYDDSLRPAGLRITQFSILSVLAQNGPISITNLANAMTMERSALARNLKPLERSGFIVIATGKNKRTRIAKLSEQGNEKLEQALPLWAEAQNSIAKKIGKTEMAKFTKISSDIRKQFE